MDLDAQRSPGGTRINVSTTFFPSAMLPGAANVQPDLIIHTQDSVFFYCHQAILRAKSSNGFAYALTPSPNQESTGSPRAVNYGPLLTLYAAEDSVTFNIVLHFIYGIPCEKYGPNVATISRALECLPKYGLPLPPPDFDVWNILMKYAPSEPLPVYTICASLPMESLCVLASQYTLHTSPSRVTEAEALVMGPIYLRRLYRLHLGRQEALRRVLRMPPNGHAPTSLCPQAAQNSLQSGWFAAVAELLMHDLPQNTSATRLSAAFAHLAGTTGCMTCGQNLEARIAIMLQDWALVRRTI